MAITTSKILVGFDLAKSQAMSGFVAPVITDGQLKYINLDSSASVTAGQVVHIGTKITRNDVFKKIVDLGQKISDVELTLEMIDKYFLNLKKFKIGNVVSIDTSLEESLKKVDTLKTKSKKLP